MFTVVLPLPNTKLNPNRSSGKHWSVTFKLKEESKKIGYYLTVQALKSCKLELNKTDRLMRIMYVYFADNYRRDDDNFLASFKAMQDGVFSALNLNDSQIDVTVLDKRVKDKNNPRIILSLSVVPEILPIDIII